MEATPASPAPELPRSQQNIPSTDASMGMRHETHFKQEGVSGVRAKKSWWYFPSRDLELLKRRSNQLGQVGKAHRPSLH